MDELLIKRWLDMYSFEEILEINGLTQEQTLGILSELGLIDHVLMDNGDDGQVFDEEAGEASPSP